MKSIETGKNRTGIDLSPVDKKLLIEGTMATIPSMEGDDSAIDETRAEYLAEGAKIGSMPPPATAKGVASTVVEAVKGNNATVFLDKLGERLAFERTGSRLYQALLGKFDAAELGEQSVPGGPTRSELEKIHFEEIAHFEMLRQAMLSLGADPTAITPSADVAAVSSMGLIQVIGDPRMTFQQSLEAILVAELVDHDCWKVLTDLAVANGHEALAEKFERALMDEAEHLSKVRTWVKNATLGTATAKTSSKKTKPVS